MALTVKINRELRQSKYRVPEDFFEFPGQTTEQLEWVLNHTGEVSNYCTEL